MAWPFADPPNVAAFTSRHILSGQDWIYYVSHDADDGAWQFHPQSGPTTEADAAVAALKTMLELEPALAEIADLPLGWCAWREARGAVWQRAER